MRGVCVCVRENRKRWDSLLVEMKTHGLLTAACETKNDFVVTIFSFSQFLLAADNCSCDSDL